MRRTLLSLAYISTLAACGAAERSSTASTGSAAAPTVVGLSLGSAAPVAAAQAATATPEPTPAPSPSATPAAVATPAPTPAPSASPAAASWLIVEHLGSTSNSGTCENICPMFLQGHETVMLTQDPNGGYVMNRPEGVMHSVDSNGLLTYTTPTQPASGVVGTCGIVDTFTTYSVAQGASLTASIENVNVAYDLTCESGHHSQCNCAYQIWGDVQTAPAAIPAAAKK